MNVAEVAQSAWSTRVEGELASRDDFLLQVCKGKKVMHLGATDSPFTEEAALRGELLHQKLATVARELRGMDVDPSAIALLRERFGIHNIECVDLASCPVALASEAEVVMCCDIVEHVNNPGILFENCSRLCRPGGELVVSTINALSIKVSLRALLGREAVHPDHVAYYSFATLKVLLGRYGFEAQACRYFAYGTVRPITGRLLGYLYRRAPQVADGIVIVARKTGRAE
jgi:SAM-dependent methyltransferase